MTTTHLVPAVITPPIPPIDTVERHGYLFGYPIAHSLSPIIHQTSYDALGLSWCQFPLPSTDMAQFLTLVRDPRCFGSAITMPHKVAIIKHLDDITPECRAVGACNTIFKRGDKLIGTNTDTIGIRESFFQNVPNPDQVYHARPGMVIGGGGAARSAVYVLVHFMKCPVVYLNCRDPLEVEGIISWCTSQGYGDGLVYVSSAQQAESLAGPGAIVACVPNFPPVTEAEKQARQVTETFLNKPHKGAILEMCYHPTPFTEIANLAELAGWQVILGTEATIYQGLSQDVYWTGRQLDELPATQVKSIIEQELQKARL